MVNFLIQVGIAIIISYLAAELTKQDVDSPVKDTKPTPLAERNAPLPFLLGRAQIAPVYLWAGSRAIFKEKTGGGKGGGDDIEQDVYYEGGWHALCVGPAFRLHKVLENGKKIKGGPFTPESHPSGSTIVAGNKGNFELYWGEQNQPVNTYLGNASRVGVESRWPFCTYINWSRKRLGPSAIWPRMAYEVEVRPFNPKLVGSSPWIRADRTLLAVSFDINAGGHAAGDPGVGYIRINEGKAARNKLKPGYYCRISGDYDAMSGFGIPDGDYKILDCVYSGIPGKSDLYLQTTIPAANSTGTVRPFSEEEDDGVNAAHAIYQLLFEPFPHGRGLDPQGFDINSLEALGVLMEDEGIRTVIFSPSSDNIDALLGQLLEDIGVMISLDPVSGLYRFIPIRETSDIAVLPEGVVTGGPIEYERIHLDLKSTTRVVFTFRDRNKDYSKMSVTIDDDGQATISGVHGADEVPMPTIGDLESATIVSLRRNQERIAAKQPYRLSASRQAKLLMPGQLFTVPELDVALICIENYLKRPGDTETSIEAFPNYYGIPASSAIISDGGGAETDLLESEEALAIIPAEIPRSLLATPEVRMGFGIVRPHEQILGAEVYISADNSTFTQISLEQGLHIGGTFNDDLAATDVNLKTLGFEFTELGPDIASVLDLSDAGQRAEWRRGRQIILTSQGEIMFLRYVTSLGGDQWRAEQVLRGRLGTTRKNHSAGDAFIILADDALTTFVDILVAPEETVYFKIAPFGSDSLPLDEIASFSYTPDGYGIRPQPVRALRVGNDGSSNGWTHGDDLVLRWGYLSELAPKTGAGEQAAGTPIQFPAEPDGTFTVRVTKGNTMTFTGLTEPTFTYPWANITSDFAIGPSFAEFTVEVEYVKGSLVSPAVSLAIRSDSP